MYPGRVRIADQRDEEEAMVLSRELWRENGMFPLNEDKVRAMLQRAFNRQGGILGVIGASGNIESMIYLAISSFWYSDAPCWEELFAYTRPAFRKTKNSVDLLGFGKWCSEQSNLPLLIGVISNERTAAKVRLYQRQLKAPVGSFFLYNANGGAAAHGI